MSKVDKDSSTKCFLRHDFEDLFLVVVTQSNKIFFFVRLNGLLFLNGKKKKKVFHLLKKPRINSCEEFSCEVHSFSLCLYDVTLTVVKLKPLQWSLPHSFSLID